MPDRTALQAPCAGSSDYIHPTPGSSDSDSPTARCATSSPMHRHSRTPPARSAALGTMRRDRAGHAEQHIHGLAYFDRITGLPDRQFLIDHLERALATLTRVNGSWRDVARPGSVQAHQRHPRTLGRRRVADRSVRRLAGVVRGGEVVSREAAGEPAPRGEHDAGRCGLLARGAAGRRRIHAVSPPRWRARRTRPGLRGAFWTELAPALSGSGATESS